MTIAAPASPAAARTLTQVPSATRPTMAGMPSLRRPPAPVVYDRLLDEAAELLIEAGWSGVTMARLADRVGVSRQTVYNTVGGKQDLAEALVMRELASFLALVDHELGRGDDLVEAIRHTAEQVFRAAADNPLLRYTLSATHGKDADELLPLLTTQSEPLLVAATEAVMAHVPRFEPDMTDDETRIAVGTVVRLVLSHVMQPTGTPEEAAADLAWIARRVLHG